MFYRSLMCLVREVFCSSFTPAWKPGLCKRFYVRRRYPPLPFSFCFSFSFCFPPSSRVVFCRSVMCIVREVFLFVVYPSLKAGVMQKYLIWEHTIPLFRSHSSSHSHSVFQLPPAWCFVMLQPVGICNPKEINMRICNPTPGDLLLKSITSSTNVFHPHYFRGLQILLFVVYPSLPACHIFNKL